MKHVFVFLVFSVISMSLYPQYFFYLTPKVHTLKSEEVFAPSDRALAIVEEAYKRRKQNYNPRRHILHAFFREYSYSLKDSTFNSLVEADVMILDRGIHRDNARVRIALGEMRRSDDMRESIFRNAFRHLTNRNVRTGNSIYSAYSAHMLKPEMNTKGWFNESFFEANDFYMQNLLVEDNDTIYEIGFYWKKKLSDPRLDQLGIIHIRQSDLAILSVEHSYQFDDFRVHHLQTFQKHEDGYYYPKIIMVSSGLTVNYTLFVYDVLTNRDELRANRSNFRFRNMLQRETNIFDIDYEYNEEFWSNYSIIQLIPIEEKLHFDLSRHRNLKEQFINPED